MKVLHIIQRYPPAIGGSETWCRNLNQFLSQKGIITKVATINLYNIEEFFKNLPLEQRYVKLGKYDYDNGVSITRYNLWSFAYNSFDVRLANFLLHTVKLCKTEIGGIFKRSPHSFDMYFKVADEIRSSDIVHLHTLPYFHNIIGFLIAKRYGKRIVITPHFHPGHIHYEMKIFYKMMNHCDAVIAMTEFEKNYLVKKGVSADRIHITGNSINQDSLVSDEEFEIFKTNLFKEHNLKEESKRIIFIGRKELYKGLGTLIEAAKGIANEVDEDISLLLVGPPSTEFTNTHSVSGDTSKLKIIDFGSVSDRDKENLLRLADVLALPSEFEAFGIVFLEAWKYKKPVVGSDRGAIPEVIKHAGLCAKYGDLDELKEKIKTVLFDTKLAAKLGERGREKLEKEFSLDNIGSKVLNIYRNLRSGKKRILIVNNLFPPHTKGGAEVVAYYQARMLKEIGYDIRIFSGMLNPALRRFKITKENSEFEITRINLHDVDFDQRSINFDKQDIQVAFRKLLFELAPDVVHFHNISLLSLNIIEESVRLHIPTAMTLHDYWVICYKNTLITDKHAVCDKKNAECSHCKEQFPDANNNMSSLKKRNEIFIRCLNSVDLIISPSRYLINKFIDCGLSSVKTAVINNGIENSRFNCEKNPDSHRIRFGYIGQIVAHKGIENLIRGVSLLSEEEKKGMSLVVVGSGESIFVDYCKKLADDLTPDNCIKFYGNVDNKRIPKILKEIDVLIVSSIWPENSPVTIMEALASGTPVLGPNIGGIPELIQDGENGYLHKHDDPEGLAINIRKILKNPRVIKQMLPACLKKAKEHNLTNQVKILSQHYDKLINSKINKCR